MPAVDAAPGDPLEGTTGVVATVPSRLASIVAGIDALGDGPPASRDEAQATVRAVGAFCRSACPVVQRCVGERCHLYNLERQAADLLSGSGPIQQEVIAL